MQILNDFSTSVKKALEEIDPNYLEYSGLVICGTHNPHNVDELIETIKVARETNTPFLGICFGHQLAAIEYARNVMGWKDATSEEFGKGVYIVRKRPQGLKVGHFEGETWWNNYEVTEEFLNLWEKNDNFITCQYHPEYQSSKEKPHPLLVKFIDYARMEKNTN